MATLQTALVLAAGLSTRMGAQNKLLLPWGQQTLIAQVVQQVVAATEGEVLVVLGYEADEVKAALTDYGQHVRFVFNPDYASGMTSSIQAGVAHAHPHSQGYMVVLGDMPLLAVAQYQNLWEAHEQAIKTDLRAIVQPIVDEKPGNPVVFSAAYREAILSHEEVEGCRELLQSNARHVVRIPLPVSAAQDADTPAQWQEVQRLYKPT